MSNKTMTTHERTAGHIGNKMNIEELAKRKTDLSQTLQAIAMSNVYGKSNEDLVALNLHQIKTQKELFEVENQIQDYILGKPTKGE